MLAEADMARSLDALGYPEAERLQDATDRAKLAALDALERLLADVEAALHELVEADAEATLSTIVSMADVTLPRSTAKATSVYRQWLARNGRPDGFVSDIALSSWSRRVRTPPSRRMVERTNCSGCSSRPSAPWHLRNLIVSFGQCRENANHCVLKCMKIKTRNAQSHLTLRHLPRRRALQKCVRRDCRKSLT